MRLPKILVLDSGLLLVRRRMGIGMTLLTTGGGDSGTVGLTLPTCRRFHRFLILPKSAAFCGAWYRRQSMQERTDLVRTPTAHPASKKKTTEICWPNWPKATKHAPFVPALTV